MKSVTECRTHVQTCYILSYLILYCLQVVKWKPILLYIVIYTYFTLHHGKRNLQSGKKSQITVTTFQFYLFTLSNYFVIFHMNHILRLSIDRFYFIHFCLLKLSCTVWSSKLWHRFNEYESINLITVYMYLYPVRRHFGKMEGNINEMCSKSLLTTDQNVPYNIFCVKLQ